MIPEDDAVKPPRNCGPRVATTSLSWRALQVSHVVLSGQKDAEMRERSRDAYEAIVHAEP